MASRSGSRDYESPSRSRTRSPAPRSDYSRSPSRGRRSPTRSRSPLDSRSPSPRRNGRARDSRSPSRDRDVRMRSRTPSESPLRSTKIVVERLTKNVNEDHLYEIFGHYGSIKDLDLPMNRQFNTNRGTAYILYDSEADAESAIAHMHEAQIDGAVINVSIVLPHRKFSPSPPLARRGANYDPRNPPPGVRGGRGGGGFGGGMGGRRGRRSPLPDDGPSRYGPRSDTYRPRSKSPPARGRGRRDYDDYDTRRRSPSRESHDSYDRRNRSRSRGRGFR
ncbi:hypothetical protein NKR23_g2088 [Pleurostoma richardsiae]|uniref:RRM domain-containing protein n=1 Tax=Pleurostoma richardsiae TaxID=41990 RepID=A0AA38RNZ3_9PEZI|nr:hypothetical protein NKR23_g2088 [Pleurostoma richardsiae]